jgi:RNA polymerase sigma-70 factor (ECF subfamily)
VSAAIGWIGSRGPSDYPTGNEYLRRMLAIEESHNARDGRTRTTAGVLDDRRVSEDAMLLRRIQAGDKRAFHDLAMKLAPSALALATRVTDNRALAEEAVQEAFADVWRRSERYDMQRGGLRQWVLGVVHHKAVDAVRRERSAADRADIAPEPTPAPNPEEESWITDRRRRVMKAVEQLAAAQREAVMLAYFGGLTYREVAEHLGVPEGTAKSRLRDGLLRLRGLLERQGIGREDMGWGAT